MDKSLLLKPPHSCAKGLLQAFQTDCRESDLKCLAVIHCATLISDIKTSLELLERVHVCLFLYFQVNLIFLFSEFRKKNPKFKSQNHASGFLLETLWLLLFSSQENKGVYRGPSHRCAHKQHDTLFCSNSPALTRSCNQSSQLMGVTGTCVHYHHLLLWHYEESQMLWVPACACDIVFVGLSRNVVITTWIQRKWEQFVYVHMRAYRIWTYALGLGSLGIWIISLPACTKQADIQIAALGLQFNLFFSCSSFFLPLWLSSCHTL